MSESTSPVRVAVVQFDPQVGTGNRVENLRRSLALATEAADGGATLIVLPELSNCGYFFSSRQDAFEHAEAVPDGPSVRAWVNFAAEHKVYLVAGLSEIEGGQLFNTSVLLGPRGYIGKYRKAHLWNLEKLWFTPGNLGFPVFETPIGRIGMLIGHLVPRSTADPQPAGRRHHLQPEQLGVDTTAAVRRGRQVHGVLPDNDGGPRQ